jgi:hypothetical protein
MDYTLAVLTHGTAPRLDSVLNSFVDKVKPTPERVIVYVDGANPPNCGVRNGWSFRTSGRQEGFCKATRDLWRWASEPADATEFVFWLEHDFTFLRPVDLHDLAVPLRDPKLAQMQLMRNAVSVEEVAAGGLYEMRREEYETKFIGMGWDDLAEAPERRWLLHRSYFTTNPSLMRTAWMAENPWPDDNEPFCEGRFGIDLVERGFHFGVWGYGEPWVQHIGQRTGFGY